MITLRTYLSMTLAAASFAKILGSTIAFSAFIAAIKTQIEASAKTEVTIYTAIVELKILAN